MRPSSISFVSVSRAISRRMPSNDESTTACGVSSMMKSTPVRCSSARMLRPSRPMMRPFMSSDGQLDERDGRLGRVARGDPLQRVGDEVAGAALRLGRAPPPRAGGRGRASSWRTSSSERSSRIAPSPRSSVIAGDALELATLRSLRLLQLLLELLRGAPRGRRRPARAASSSVSFRSMSSSFASDALLDLQRPRRAGRASSLLDLGAQPRPPARAPRSAPRGASPRPRARASSSSSWRVPPRRGEARARERAQHEQRGAERRRRGRSRSRRRRACALLTCRLARTAAVRRSGVRAAPRRPPTSFASGRPRVARRYRSGGSSGRERRRSRSRSLGSWSQDGQRFDSEMRVCRQNVRWNAELYPNAVSASSATAAQSRLERVLAEALAARAVRRVFAPCAEPRDERAAPARARARARRRAASTASASSPSPSRSCRIAASP